MKKIRIMTYNLGWLQGEGSEGVNYKPRSKLHFTSGITAVTRTIQENQIDIAAVQEIDFFSKKSHFIDQYLKIKEKLSYYAAKVVCWNQLFLPFPYHRPWGRVNSGGAVFSKYPLKEVENALFDAPSDMFFLKRFFYLNRYIQVLKIIINDREEYIFNLHLEAFDFKSKVEQILALKKLINKYQPLLVMGDLNTIPEGFNLKVDIDYSDDPAVELLPAVMKDYQDIFGDKLTFPAGKENCRLDYIWVKKGIKAQVVDLNILFNPSDHQPLALELELPE